MAERDTDRAHACIASVRQIREEIIRQCAERWAQGKRSKYLVIDTHSLRTALQVIEYGPSFKPDSVMRLSGLEVVALPADGPMIRVVGCPMEEVLW